MHSRVLETGRKALNSKVSEQTPIDRYTSPFKGFENSFQCAKRPRIGTDGAAGKNWQSFGEGFSDLGLQGNRSRTTQTKRKSAKRKISELSSDRQDVPCCLQEDLSDPLVSDIKWQSSSDSESEDPKPSVAAESGASHSSTSILISSPKKKPRRQSIRYTSKWKSAYEGEAADVDITDVDVKAVKDAKNRPGDDDVAQKDQPLSICSFDSSSDDEHQPDALIPLVQEKVTSQDISAPSSSSSSPKPSTSQIPSTTGIKAGDWLKNVQWQAVTPTKTAPPDDQDDVEDSAKKKRKKYARSSMAEQLNKLQSREKSARTLWYHKAKETASASDSSQDSSKSMVMRVSAVSVVCSLCVASCVGVDHPAPVVSAHLPPSPGDPTTPEQSKRVLFPHSCPQSQRVRAGMVIKIHPPWQTLNIPAVGEELILCSYFTVLNPIPKDAIHIHDASAAEPTVTRHKALWQCPCSQDWSDPRRCPATKVPCPTSLEVVTPRGLTPEASTSNPSGGLETKGHNPGFTLHTVVASQRGHAGAATSILDSIERVGHSTTKDLNFSAKICRVFRQKTQPSGTVKWSMLVEDHHGVFASVHLPNHSDQLDAWRDVLQGEGLVVRLAGVTLHSRTNRDRAPLLFSVLDCVWSESCDRGRSQDFSTQGSSSQTQTLSRPTPGFCYLMKTWHGRSAVTLTPDDPSVTSEARSRVRCQPLNEILSSLGVGNASDDRVSFLCKVMYVDMLKTVSKSLHSNSEDCCMSLYVADQSLVSSHLSSSHNGPSPTHSVVVCVMKSSELNEFIPGYDDLLHIRDAYLHNGKLILDEFSRAVRIPKKAAQTSLPIISDAEMEASDVLSKTKVYPLVLSEDSGLGSLVTLEGVIASVNEDECYTWLECDRCANEHLTSDSRGVLRCERCEGEVTSPDTHVKMEVGVQNKAQESGHMEVMVQLHQMTAKNLLPGDATQEDYDISCVLGSEIGPMGCVVLEKQRLEDNSLKFRLLEVKMLLMS